MKSYSIIAKLTYSLNAQNEEQAGERGEKVLEALLAGKAITNSWYDENLESEIEVEECIGCEYGPGCQHDPQKADYCPLGPGEKEATP